MARPALKGVLETVLYFDDQSAAERFYVDVLGMRLLSKQPGRSLFFRAGDGVLLLFDPDAAAAGGSLPPHGARGPGHVCFVVEASAYEPWKAHLSEHGVAILQEARWPGPDGEDGGRSFYFRDPCGNLLEIANADIWPR